MDVVRKRLLFRAHHMGTNENDIVFGDFADHHLAHLDSRQLLDFEALLAVGDPDLFLWVTGAMVVPPAYDTALMAMLQIHTRTRAPR